MDDFWNIARREVSHFLPEAAKMLNVSIDDCYLTSLSQDANHARWGRNMDMLCNNYIILMSIFEDKVSYVVLGKFSLTLRVNKDTFSFEKRVHSLYFDDMTSIYTKLDRIELNTKGDKSYTLQTYSALNNELADKLTDELVAKFENYKNNKNNPTNTSDSQSNNKADALMKYKELLDSGVLTQEEFDKLKDELING